MAETKTKLVDAWNEIKNIMVDLATVDVTTMQGDITIKLEGGKPFTPNNVFEFLQGQIKDGSTLTLVAHTHVDFDLDSVMITKPGTGAELMEAHNQAVKTAIDARQAVLRLVKECF